jgi:outer membrane cobalamin receptor
VTDIIEGRPIPDNPFGCFRAENFGNARFDGVEWIMNMKLLTSLTLNANYTYLNWHTEDGTLPRRSKNVGNVTLNYMYDKWNVNFGANIIGRRDDFRAAFPFGTITKPGYVIFTLASYYTLPWRVPAVKDLTLMGKIENLANLRYEQADGFRAPPLNFLLGFRVTFGG